MRLLLLILFISWLPLSAQQKMNFATSADTEHYDWALNLIATIHHFHDQTLGEIAVFDLGLTEREKKELELLKSVKVYSVEPVNPDMLVKFTVNDQGKIARGWYSWKPVVLKQALDVFAEVLYLDAGITVMGSCERIFELMRQNGCFLIDCGHDIQRMSTQLVRKHFELEKSSVLKELGISAGVQGLTRSVKQIYIMPIYEMAKEIAYFVDDGSAPRGFGWARHDQALFSIQARLLNLPIAEGVKNGELVLMGSEKRETLSFNKYFKFSRGQFDLSETKRFLRYGNSEK